MLLALTGYGAVVMAVAVYRMGRSQEAFESAIEGTIAHGLLLLISFAAYTALERPYYRIVALLGLGASGVMQLIMPLFTAMRILYPYPRTMFDPRVPIAAVGLMTAGLLCLIPFVLVPRMKRVGRIVQWTTVVYLTVAYVITTLRLLRIDTDRVDEAVVTLLVPAAACMMGVFALHLYFGVQKSEPYTSVSPVIHVRCPRCQRDQLLGIGESRCTHCRLRIAIAVEEPVCPNCRYNLHRLTQPTCPECGFDLDKEDVPEGEAAAQKAARL